MSGFESEVDKWVLAALKAGHTAFTELLRNLPGVYPESALSSVVRLAADSSISFSLSERIRAEARLPVRESLQDWSLLPIPHPLDFEWRFTSDSSRRLLELATTLKCQNSTILLFGTPGVAIEALSHRAGRRTIFVGEDNVVTRRITALNSASESPLSIATCTLGLPTKVADVVILDPPWYLDFIRPMLSAAAAACNPFGHVLISLPPLGTRPTAAIERETIVRFAARLGLDRVEEQPLAINYQTPLFERNALAVSGIRAPSQWRRGDLLVFQKCRESRRPALTRSNRKQQWTEVSVDRMRLFVKCDRSSASGLKGLIPLIEGDILPSVSRRDPRRREAHVWTSGNRIFATDNPRLVLDTAMSYHRNQSSARNRNRLRHSDARQAALRRIREALMQLAATEATEERGARVEIKWRRRADRDRRIA